MKYGLTLDNQNLILEKAKTKKNGIYKFRGVVYKVEQSRVTHFCTSTEVIRFEYGFNIVIKKLVYNYDWETAAKKILKENK